MALHAYIASFEESDGFACDHVLHGPNLSEVERAARIDAHRRNATLVAVRPALAGRHPVRRRGSLRAGVTKTAPVLAAAILAALILLIQSSGSA